MAYEIAWYHEFYDIGKTIHRVDILEKDYSGGATRIDYSDASPVRLTHQGSKKDFEKTIIQGQQLIFTFHSARADVDTFDALFDADYKDYKVKYYIDGQLEFEGYIKPENLSKQYVKDAPYIIISLSATDALADLKDEDFVDSTGNPISDRLTILEVIKHALTPLDIDLEIQVQLNTFESDFMLATNCALKEIIIDPRRFFEDKTGRRVYMSCWKVLEIVLQNFNCTLKQSKGKYQITNPYELDSYQFLYDWATLTQQSRTATSNILDVSAYDFNPRIEQQKIRPLDKVGITFQNKDLGGDATGLDLDDWGNAAVWTIDFSNGYTVSDGIVSLNSNDNTYDEHMITATFAVSKVTENDYLKVTFNHIVDLYSMPGGEFEDLVPDFLTTITVIRPDNSEHLVNFYGSESWQPYESGMLFAFKIVQTGNYRIKMSFNVGRDPYTTARFKVKNFRITGIINPTEEEYHSEVAYDKYYEQLSNKGIEVFSVTTLLADADQVSEIGAMLYDDSGVIKLTTTWRTYGYTEDIKLLDIYARNILNNRYEYKNYLRKVKISDRSNNITFNNILTIQSKNYIFISYTRDSRDCFVTADLVQLLTTRESYGPLHQTTLTSIDGESIGSSTTVDPIPPHAGLADLQGGQIGQYYHFNSSEYTELHGWLDNVTLASDGKTTLPKLLLENLADGYIPYFDDNSADPCLVDSTIHTDGVDVWIGESSIAADLTVNGAITAEGIITSNTINHEATDVDKFLVSNSGAVKYRTGAEVLSDIGGVITDNQIAVGTGTGIEGDANFTWNSTTLDVTGNLDFSGTGLFGGSLTVATIANEATDVDKFLVSNSGLVKYRTGVEVLSDIGGAASVDAIKSVDATNISAVRFTHSDDSVSIISFGHVHTEYALITQLVTQLSDLSDVGATTPTDKNALMADGDSWESRALVEADISDFGSYATSGANTNITSLQNTALYVGRDSDNKIDWGTDNHLKITIAGSLTDVVSISAGAGDNDKLVTQGYVDDAISGEDFWDRAGTTIEPKTANDNLNMGSGNILTTGDIGADGSRITKGWFTDLECTNAIAGSITGNAATATALQNARTIGGVSFDGTANIVPETIAVVDESSDTSCYVLFVTAATGSLQPKTGTNLTFNSSSGILTATGFAGDLTGNVTGNVSGSSGSCTGNALTATTLETARDINGVAFDGSANITVTAAAGTLTGNTLNATVVTSSLTTVGTIGTGVWEGTDVGVTHGGTGVSSFTQYLIIYAATTTSLGQIAIGTSGQVLTSNGAGSVSSFQSPAAASTIVVVDESSDTTCFPLFVTTATGNLAAKTASGLTFNSATDVLSATGFSGPLTGNVTGNVSGSSGSCTGNAATATALETARTIGGVSFNGTANIVPTTIVVADESSDTTCFIAFFTAASGSLLPKTGTNLTFNSADGTLTATSFSGANVTSGVDPGHTHSAPAAHAASHEIGGGDLVDHDNLTNYVADEHIDHTAITLTAGDGLTGGGTIADNRTFTLGTPATLTSTTSNAVTATSHTHAITTGISDTNIVRVDHASVADNDYAKFTTNGLEGRSYAEILSDLGLTNPVESVDATNISAVVFTHSDDTESVVSFGHVHIEYRLSTQETVLSGDVSGSGATAITTTIGADKVLDSHINWGTGATQVSAVDMPIADGGSIITATEVEGALQENRTAIDLNTAKVTMTYPAAGIALSTGSAWSASITDNSVNWNTAYSERLRWDGGDTDLVAATGRTSLGGTTIGSNIFTATNPGAITFLRANANNTVSLLNAADFRTAINVDVAGTDNSTNVTLAASATTGGLSLSTQEIGFRAATNAQTGYATAAHIIAIEANTAKVISDVAYDATSWNNNPDAASKNALRDKIEAMLIGFRDLDMETLVTVEDPGISMIKPFVYTVAADTGFWLRFTSEVVGRKVVIFNDQGNAVSINDSANQFQFAVPADNCQEFICYRTSGNPRWIRIN